jgi:hypothetical protein
MSENRIPEGAPGGGRWTHDVGSRPTAVLRCWDDDEDFDPFALDVEDGETAQPVEPDRDTIAGIVEATITPDFMADIELASRSAERKYGMELGELLGEVYAAVRENITIAAAAGTAPKFGSQRTAFLTTVAKNIAYEQEVGLVGGTDSVAWKEFAVRLAAVEDRLGKVLNGHERMALAATIRAEAPPGRRPGPRFIEKARQSSDLSTDSSLSGADSHENGMQSIYGVHAEDDRVAQFDGAVMAEALRRQEVGGVSSAADIRRLKYAMIAESLDAPMPVAGAVTESDIAGYRRLLGRVGGVRQAALKWSDGDLDEASTAALFAAVTPAATVLSEQDKSNTAAVLLYGDSNIASEQTWSCMTRSSLIGDVLQLA